MSNPYKLEREREEKTYQYNILSKLGDVLSKKYPDCDIRLHVNSISYNSSLTITHELFERHFDIGVVHGEACIIMDDCSIAWPLSDPNVFDEIAKRPLHLFPELKDKKWTPKKKKATRVLAITSLLLVATLAIVLIVANVVTLLNTK